MIFPGEQLEVPGNGLGFGIAGGAKPVAGLALALGAVAALLFANARSPPGPPGNVNARDALRFATPTLPKVLTASYAAPASAYTRSASAQAPALGAHARIPLAGACLPAGQSAHAAPPEPYRPVVQGRSAHVSTPILSTVEDERGIP